MGCAFKISINVQITLSVRPQNALANESPYVSLYTRPKSREIQHGFGKIGFKEI